MTRQFFIPVMCILVLVVIFLGSGCTTHVPDGTPTPTTIPATITTGNHGRPDCGLTPCHGLDIACGPDIPEVCTAVYQLGDKCRQFAHCEIDSDGTCRMVTTQEFETCKSCVLACLNESRHDPSKSFACEEKC